MKGDVLVMLGKGNELVPRLLIAAIGLLIAAMDTNAQSIWSPDFFRCPLAVMSRRQVEHRLGKLSSNLQELASDKQYLADALSRSSDTEILDAITELEQTIQRMRQNLDRITRILHPADRQRGGEIANQLFRDLTRKHEVLETARRNLEARRQLNRNLVREGLDEGVRLALETKSRVDSLITELQNRPCPP